VAVIDFLIDFLTVVAVIGGLIALVASAIIYSWIVEDQENDQ
jgi:hypothetical protein